jgi:GNAT superfamily N-acetyltransferase
LIGDFPFAVTCPFLVNLGAMHNGWVHQTRLPEELAPFLRICRKVTWEEEKIPQFYELQSQGILSMFVAWIPESCWNEQLKLYERDHGIDLLHAYNAEELISLKLRSTIRDKMQELQLPNDSQKAATQMVKWLPCAAVTVSWKNWEYTAEELTGDMSLYANLEMGIAGISSLVILPPFRGQGYAKHILDFIEQHVLLRCGPPDLLQSSIDFSRISLKVSPERGIKCAVLCTGAEKERNIKMYQKRGYEIRKTCQLHWGDAVFFRKQLSLEPLPNQFN